MFCGNIFTCTDLQNHKKTHMKKSQKRFNRVNRALFLSLNNEFEEQKLIPKVDQNFFFYCTPFFQDCLWGTVCTATALVRFLPSVGVGMFLQSISCSA